MNSGINTMNYIRTNSSKAYQDAVPVATKTNIQEIGNILLNDAYQPMLNEFVNNLINRIALTIVRNKSYDNPLAMFKKGSVPLGTDIQDIYENPANPEPYEYSDVAMQKLLTITDPDTHVAYYRRNRQDLYTKTITREGLQGAFASWDKFNDFITAITQSLYSGNYISEFDYTKGLIDGAYDNNKVIVEVVDAVKDETSATAFVKKLRALYSKMSFPSTEYNAYSKFSGAKGVIKTWTNKDRICVIVTADIMAEVDVDVLARAFNMDKADFLGRVIEIDKFENPEIQAVICDEAWLQIYDNIFRFDEFYNARTMSWNEYLHAWGTFAICPFANAVVLATEQPNPATNIAFASDSVNITGVGSQEDVVLTITPSGATTDIEYYSSDTSIFTIEKTDNTKSKVTATGVGSATLTAQSDNGLKATTTVNVTEG